MWFFTLLGQSGLPRHLSLVKVVLRMLLAQSGLALKSVFLNLLQFLLYTFTPHSSKLLVSPTS